MSAISKGYPWRASLTKKARCATCKRNSGAYCTKGHKRQYPLYTKTHDCPDFDFKPSPPPGTGSEDELLFPECSECGYNFVNKCTGIRWRPISKKDGKCNSFAIKIWSARMPFRIYSTVIICGIITVVYHRISGTVLLSSAGLGIVRGRTGLELKDYTVTNQKKSR